MVLGVLRRYADTQSEQRLNAAPTEAFVRSESGAREAGRQRTATPRIYDSDDEDEDTLRSYEPIDLLQDAGINAADIANLKSDGFATIGQLFQVSQRQLRGVKGISEGKVDKVLCILGSCLRLNVLLNVTWCVPASSSW
ncbi:unnamed protein product [Phytophthora fragariaefolia]|uniref:Unnamed protein product n=1 Tax=Phytophthora fragariaefolia TaxID=1490495 RepID=A0A9W6TQN1_9STRA|nr:unnamed protein product [Phytophthora fragariaefolia]